MGGSAGEASLLSAIAQVELTVRSWLEGIHRPIDLMALERTTVNRQETCTSRTFCGNLDRT